VGTIRDVFEKNGDWFASVEMQAKYAGMVLPPFCSPAIFQNNPLEPDGHIADWEALHLAGLMEDPAYGIQVALLKGTCMGSSTACSIQFKGAKLAKTECPRSAALHQRLAGMSSDAFKKFKAKEDRKIFDSMSDESLEQADDIFRELTDRPKAIKKNLSKKPSGFTPDAKKRFAAIFDEQEANIERGSNIGISRSRKTSFNRTNKLRKELGVKPIDKQTFKLKNIKKRIAALRSDTNAEVNVVNVRGEKKKKKKRVNPPKVAKKHKIIKKKVNYK